MPLILIPVTQFPETCLPESCTLDMLHRVQSTPSCCNNQGWCHFVVFSPMIGCVGRKHASFISGHTSRKSDLEILAENLNLLVAEEKDCNFQ